MSAPTQKYTFRKRDEELDRYIRPQTCRDWPAGQPQRRRRGLSGNRRTPAAQLQPEGPAAGELAMRQRQPHTGLSRCVPQRRLPPGRRAHPRQHFCAGPRRHGSRLVPAGDCGLYLVAVSRFVSSAAGGCTIRQAIAGLRRIVPHCRGRASGPGRQSGGAESKPLRRRGSAALRRWKPLNAAFTQIRRKRACCSAACCGPGPSGSRLEAGKKPGNGSSCWEPWPAIWTPVEHRQCGDPDLRKNDAGSRARTGPDTPAASLARTSAGIRSAVAADEPGDRTRAP